MVWFRSIISHLLWRYGVSRNLAYTWNFGVSSFLCLLIQISTGLFLAMYYVTESQEAFRSVEHIMRDVTWGWFVRYSHANGASFSFSFVYLHLLRNIYYFSYTFPRWEVWVIGILIPLLMIITAFLGYVLPWGQMSFRAATVITNLFSAIPIVGGDMVDWLWGGYAVERSTLIRFYCLHFVLPFVILALVILHVPFLHQPGSSNPLGPVSTKDTLFFGPYYLVKDILSILVFLFVFFIFVFFYPNASGHPDNYVMANPVVTPSHIVPEWYFLPFYAILRSIPNKLGGILVSVCAIILLLILPFISFSVNRSRLGNILHKSFFWLFIVDCVLLGWVGGQPIDYPYVEFGQALTVYHFLYSGVWLGKLERYFVDTKIMVTERQEFGILNKFRSYMHNLACKFIRRNDQKEDGDKVEDLKKKRINSRSAVKNDLKRRSYN